jgi:hypothetical protein
MGGRTFVALGTLVVGAAVGTAPVDAQVRVSLNWLQPAEVMFVSDFNPFSAGRQPDLMGIMLQNGSPAGQTVLMELTISMMEPQSVMIFRGRTDVFLLDQPIRNLTNRDMATPGRDVGFRDFEVGRRAEEMGDRMMETGRFPAGLYRFELEVRTPQGIVLDRAELLRELTNPSRVELITPGRPFGESPPVVTSPSPRFLWGTDGDQFLGGAEYRIRVVAVDDDASPEAAMQGFASWDALVTATTALYPGSSAAIRLESGGLYAWQVTRRVRTSAGIEELQSPIYWFRMAGAQGVVAGSGTQAVLARQLRQLAGRVGLEEEVSDFRPSGPYLLDGRPISLEDLQILLQAVLDGDAALTSIIVR